MAILGLFAQPVRLGPRPIHAKKSRTVFARAGVTSAAGLLACAAADRGVSRRHPDYPSVRALMRRPRHLLAFALLISLVAIRPASATIIDRIAVSVGNRVIATSDIDREIRIAAFLNGTQPDFSSTARRAAAARLVEQTLVRLEVENSRYPAPSAADVEAALDKFKKNHFADEAAYKTALASYGLTEHDLMNELIWQRTLLSYIDVRFRPAVQVTDQEIQDYFTNTVEPAADAAHPGHAATLNEYRDRIEQTLTGNKEDEQLNRWLDQAKQRNQIVYHDEAFQ